MARKPNPPLPPGSPGEIIPPSQPASLGPDEWGCKIGSVGFAIDLNPAIIADRMRRRSLEHHRDSLLEGVRPDGGGPQKPLGKRALAAPNRQSEHRGYNTGVLADGLKSSKIKVSGNKATCTIVPPTNRNVYVAQERRRGVDLLTLAGKSGEVAREAAREAVAVIAMGGKVPVDDSEVDSEEAAK